MHSDRVALAVGNAQSLACLERERNIIAPL
jgi:hypothetical protein